MIMDETAKIDELFRRLDAHREAYLETFQKTHEAVAQILASASNGSTSTSVAATAPLSPLEPPSSPRGSVSRAVSDREHVRKTSTGLSTLQTSSSASKATGEDSDDDSDESLYVQELLEPQSFDHEELREHLREYDFDDYGKKILEGVVDDLERLKQAWLFPTQLGPAEDRSHYSHYQVFDVGTDGAPLQIDLSESKVSQATAIWLALKDINQPSRARKAVGRITIAREFSPILFGAVHLTTHRTFDTDELFRNLVDSGASSASMHRAFDSDPRRQSSFVFNFEYFTIIGDDCQPMQWQMADRQRRRNARHIPITRCSSVVALALDGKPIKKLRNPARRAKNTHGFAYDIWAPWQVLNLQCYPDWKSSTDVHDSTKHYVNGVEAFMATLLGEYRDAERRFEDIYKRITHLITPPLDFMFNSDIRDKLLFEDGDFTYSRRYFWAFQTLGLMNDSIKSMVDAYEDTFTDDVWEGKHKTLWPLLEEHSGRNVYYKKKMASLRVKFTVAIQNLKTQIAENNQRRTEIRNLRDQLFSGTSVLESRRSVEMTEITVQQGHNIKLLTLVSIFFLPLTFVTSVFGMTNMVRFKLRIRLSKFRDYWLTISLSD